MLPGVCTWCGCAVKARGAVSPKCTGCRHWLLSDLAAGTSGESWTYVAVPFRVDVDDTALRFVPRGARWRAYAWPGILFLGPPAASLLGLHDPRRHVLTALVGALAAIAWLLDRPRVLVDRAGIRLVGGWRRSRSVPADRVRDIAIEGASGLSVNVVAARCDSEERIDLAVFRDSESARVFAEHVRRALGRRPVLPVLPPLEPVTPSG